MKEDSFNKWRNSGLKKEREARNPALSMLLDVLWTLLKRVNLIKS